MDEYIEVEEPTGCLQSFKQAIGKVGTGFVMILVAFPLLFWNEGRAVKRAQDLATGKGAVVSTEADKIDSSLDGELIHLSGDVAVQEPARDSKFDIEADAVVLDRVVEMYQWKENKKTETKKINGEKKKVTKYTYTKEWSSSEINSSSFKKSAEHPNPAMPLEGETFYANKASLGAYELSSDVKRKWSADQSHQLDEEDLASFSPLNDREPVLNGSEVLFGDPSNTKVGDVRISYKVAPPGKSSVIAGLSGDTLVKYSSPDLNSALLEVRSGVKSAEAMFEEAEAQNTTMTWILRFVGLFMMFSGFSLVFGPISVLAGRIPILGGIVGLGTTLVAGILAFGLSFITIAIGWIFYRPLIGIPLLLLGLGAIGGGAFLVFKKMKEKKDEEAPPAANGAV
jgi:hypothetical protein